MRSTCRWMALTACLAAACADAAKDPGPFDIDGWIGQCEDRCEQQSSCEPEEFLFYHGDMDNCLRDCPYYLERDENLAFVEETPDACLEALYAQVKCVFHMSCDDLDSWDVDNSHSHCGEETTAAEEACAGIDVGGFLQDCGWPQDHDTDL
ncbi:MAG: hypothetical protein M0R80_29505 [Proteobacteria bacterium]|nr:hypothetical protein [Pseudomonadota bacterium]